MTVDRGYTPTLSHFRSAGRVGRGTPFTQIKWISRNYDPRNWFACKGDARKIWGVNEVARMRLYTVKQSGRKFLWGLKG